MEPAKIRFCAGCGASLTPQARFCGECGAEDRAWAKRRFTELKREGDRVARAFLVAGGVFAAVIASLFIASFLEVDLTPTMVVLSASDLGIGVVALFCVGAPIRQALGRVPSGRDLGLSAAVSVGTLAVAFGWVAILELLSDAEPWECELPPLLTALFAVAVLPAVFEEWLCRGALWRVIRPVTGDSAGTAIVTTSILFAFMHALNGGLLFELPHRFVMGLALGWLRARTGSLAPCILAHFLHNAAATVWDAHYG